MGGLRFAWPLRLIESRVARCSARSLADSSSAEADEIVVSSRLVSRLMARSSLYPGLAELVTDIVSGGEGSELYRVSLPDEYVGFTVDQLSAKLRLEHRATLLSVSRGGQSYVNPPEDFRLSNGDDLVVVAESLGTLAPLQMDHDLT